MADPKTGLRDVREHGGAAILEKLLRALFADDGSVCIRLGISKPELDGSQGGYHAYAFWKPHLKDQDEKEKKPDKQEKVWRTSMQMGYGDAVEIGGVDPKAYKPVPTEDRVNPDVLLLDDAGFEFRSAAQQNCWLLPPDGAAVPSWIILKMSKPIGHGDLWYNLLSYHRERLVCIVSIDELRLDSVNIARGLSWERTVEDLRHALSSNPTFGPLNTLPHLLVSISTDAVLWVDRSNRKPSAKLIFDAGGAEGGWNEAREGQVFGMSATLTAAVARQIALAALAEPGKKPELRLESAIKAGLAAMRELQSHGHGPVREAPLPDDWFPAKGFPADRVAEVIIEADPLEITKRDKTIASAAVPPPGEPLRRPDGTWMIIEDTQWPPGIAHRPPLVGLARQVVFRGLPALDKQPHARLGKLVTVDRNEIETLRALRRLMVAYAAKKDADKPLSIGVFGRPGSGKSFGVKEISKGVFGEKAWLEFNLSQFAEPTDLIGAFHQVRDKVLSGVTPVVFWDEFDSRSYYWLQFLLAPMQDGRFQGGQISHWIGKCVFVFAGGTSWTFEEFGPAQDAPEEDKQAFRNSKGPDFHSRLDAYYDVTGPNQRSLPKRNWPDPDVPKPDPSDVSFPLRRALLMRSKLGYKDDKEIEFDSDLLDALLLVREYRHGARSLEKLVADLRPSDDGGVLPSRLPPPRLAAMHVDPGELDALLRRNESYLNSGMIETLAAAIHHNYLASVGKAGAQENFRPDFAHLREADKAPNRAAARRYPRLLSLIGARIVDADEADCVRVPAAQLEALLALHLEVLAEEEHRGWMEERRAEGWRPGAERKNPEKIHDLLTTYGKLSEPDKDKDRKSVLNIPKIMTVAGFDIAWLDQPAPASS